MPVSQETVLRPVGGSLGAIIPVRAIREAGIRPGERLHVQARPGAITLTRRLDDPAARGALRLLKPFIGKEVLAVALFGSYLSRRFKKGRSDVDLFVVVRRRTIPLETRIYKALRGTPYSASIYGADELDACAILEDARSGYAVYGSL
ncbi:MAG: nucleotidyltransferase domain-containing protein [Halobacteria archaeon]